MSGRALVSAFMPVDAPRPTSAPHWSNPAPATLHSATQYIRNAGHHAQNSFPHAGAFSGTTPFGMTEGDKVGRCHCAASVESRGRRSQRRQSATGVTRRDACFRPSPVILLAVAVSFRRGRRQSACCRWCCCRSHMVAVWTGCRPSPMRPSRSCRTFVAQRGRRPCEQRVTYIHSRGGACPRRRTGRCACSSAAIRSGLRVVSMRATA